MKPLTAVRTYLPGIVYKRSIFRNTSREVARRLLSSDADNRPRWRRTASEKKIMKEKSEYAQDQKVDIKSILIVNIII